MPSMSTVTRAILLDVNVNKFIALYDAGYMYDAIVLEMSQTNPDEESIPNKQWAINYARLHGTPPPIMGHGDMHWSSLWKKGPYVTSKLPQPTWRRKAELSALSQELRPEPQSSDKRIHIPICDTDADWLTAAFSASHK